MQRLFAVKYSRDSKYVLSGSDETNIRLWKSLAWEKLGPVSAREKTALQYNTTLINRYQHHPQVKRIKRHRNIPSMVRSISKEHQTIRSAAKVREENKRKHSKPGAVPRVAERAKHIVSEGA